MTPTLRPMSLGEILDRTFLIYRSRFLLFVGVAAMPAVLTMAEYGGASAWMIRHPVHDRNLLLGWSLSRLIWMALAYVVYGFTHLLFRPVFVRLVSGAVTGANLSLLQSLALKSRRWRTMIALNGAEQLIMILVPFSIFIPCFAAAGSAVGSARSDQVTVAIAYLLLILVGGTLAGAFIWSGAGISLSFPAAELEGVSWLSAMKRSWRISKKSRGRIIFTWLAIASGGWIANILIRWVVYFALRFFWRSPTFWVGVPSYIFYDLLPRVFVSSLIGPLYPIALTLFYYDQRIRLEGYDIERMMDAAGLNAAATLPASESPLAHAGAEEGGA